MTDEVKPYTTRKARNSEKYTSNSTHGGKAFLEEKIFSHAGKSQAVQTTAAGATHMNPRITRNLLLVETKKETEESNK